MNLINKCIDDTVDTDSHDVKSYNAADFIIWFEQSWKLKYDNSPAARATGPSITAAKGNSIPPGPSNAPSQRWINPDQKSLDDWVRTKRSMEAFEVLTTDAYYPSWKHVFNLLMPNQTYKACLNH